MGNKIMALDHLIFLFTRSDTDIEAEWRIYASVT